MSHQHAFERYNAVYDRWACKCGVSMDRFNGLWNADGTRMQISITCTTENGDRVASGRERLTC